MQNPKTGYNDGNTDGGRNTETEMLALRPRVGTAAEHTTPKLPELQADQVGQPEQVEARPTYVRNLNRPNPKYF